MVQVSRLFFEVIISSFRLGLWLLKQQATAFFLIRLCWWQKMEIWFLYLFICFKVFASFEMSALMTSDWQILYYFWFLTNWYAFEPAYWRFGQDGCITEIVRTIWHLWGMFYKFFPLTIVDILLRQLTCLNSVFHKLPESNLVHLLPQMYLLILSKIVYSVAIILFWGFPLFYGSEYSYWRKELSFASLG